MRLHEAANPPVRQAADSQRISKNRAAEFRLGNKVCKAVPEDEITSYAIEQQDEKQPDGQDISVRHKVVGQIIIDGVRYVVFCVAEKHGDDAEDTLSKIADILTRRELQIAMLVAQGRVNKQIAHQLKVSEWTVSSHLRRIYAKLGVRTRAAMVACVMQGSHRSS